MAEWWESAPLVEQQEQPQQAPPANWWENAPRVEDQPREEPRVYTAQQAADEMSLPIPGTDWRTPEQPEQPSTNPLLAAQAGAMQGMTFGFNDEIMAGLMTPIEIGADALAGETFDPGRSFNQALELTRATDAAMQEQNPLAYGAGNLAGGVGTGIGLARNGISLMRGASPNVGSMATRGAIEGAAYGGLHGLGVGTDDKIGSTVDGALWGGATGGFIGALSGALASRSAGQVVPTVDELKAQAGALYDQARASGVVAPLQATQALNQTMTGIATAEGLITPAGRVNSSYPRIAGVLNTFEDFSAGAMDIPQAQAVRKVLSDAAKSNEPGERRIATMMLEEFDRFLDPLAPDIATANAIYSRAKKGELIEQAIELAGSRAGQFSGSGFENALRTEFRGLERQIIRGQLRGLSQPEIEAITRVAQGGPIENALRMVGKLAPTGVVSMGMGGGVPFMIGNAFGGPAVGAAAGATTMGLGMGARAGATRMTSNNARQAVIEALMAGQPAPQANPAISSVAQALIAGGGSFAPEFDTSIARLLALN